MSILVFLQYTGITTVCRFAGIKFLLDINTGMTKIPSFQFNCVILPSSNIEYIRSFDESRIATYVIVCIPT